MGDKADFFVSTAGAGLGSLDTKVIAPGRFLKEEIIALQMTAGSLVDVLNVSFSDKVVENWI